MLLCIVSFFVPLVVSSRGQALLGLDEGDVCKKAADAPWTCTSLKKCAHVDIRVLRPSICSFRGREPIICCPPKKMSKAEMSCLNATLLCSKFNMFRTSDASTRSSNDLDWADFGDDALAIQIPMDLETTTSTRSSPEPTEAPSSTVTVPTRVSSTEWPEKLESTTGTAVSNGKPSNTTDALPPPKGRQWVVGCARVSELPCPQQQYFGPSSSSLPPSSVVGGKISEIKTQRQVAAIGYGQAGSISWNCGGSLVSELWVMSAAHCTSTPDLGEAKWARLGELDLASTSEDARPQDRRIVRRINHPQYRPPAAYHDISLYKLDSPVVFNKYVAPVCLHTTFDIGEKKATVVGWGSIEFAGTTSDKLMEVDVSLVENAECRLRYGSEDQQAPNGIDNMAMVCAGEKEGGKDACTGDSGGPLAINQPGTCLKKQVGITSFGRDCGLPNTPGIYTRVSTYVPWIESIVWP